MKDDDLFSSVVALLLGLCLFVCVLVLVGAVLALPVMWLWNGLMPAIFNLPALGFFQSWGILILTGLLFRDSK